MQLDKDVLDVYEKLKFYNFNKLPTFIETENINTMAYFKNIMIIFPYRNKIFFYGAYNIYIDINLYLNRNGKLYMPNDQMLSEYLTDLNIKVTRTKEENFIKDKINIDVISLVDKSKFEDIVKNFNVYNETGEYIGTGLIVKIIPKKRKIVEIKKYKCECGNIFEMEADLEPVCDHCSSGFENKENNSFDNLYDNFKNEVISNLTKSEKSLRYAKNYYKGIPNKMFLEDIL